MMFQTGDIIKRYKKSTIRAADYYIVMGRKHNSRLETSLYIVGFYNNKTVSTGWVLHEIYFDNFRVVGHVDKVVKMSDDKYPDMSAMYSVMFAAEDKLKEEIQKLKQELITTRKALDIAIDALKKIDNTRSVAKENLYASYGKSLNSGIVFCWTTLDEIHNTLQQIESITKAKEQQ